MTESMLFSAAPNFTTTSHVEGDELRLALLALWRKNLPMAAEHRTDWLYGTGRAKAWLLKDVESRDLGAAGLMLRTMLVGGRRVECGAAIDLNVDSSMRSLGPALTLVRAVVGDSDRDGRELLFGMPNDSATAVMKRAGYREVGRFSVWTKLLRTGPTISKRIPFRRIAGFCAASADVAIRLAEATTQRKLPQHLEAACIGVGEFDERFDQLWSRSANRFDVIGDRGSEYLGWRFAECRDLDYRVMTLQDRDSRELKAYAIWFEQGDSIWISDFLADDDDSMNHLLAELSRLARRTNWLAIRITCFGSSQLYAQLKRAGFRRRQDRHAVICRTRPDSPPTGTNWFLTMADSDTEV